MKTVFSKSEHVMISVATPSALKLLRLFDIFRLDKHKKIIYLVIGGSLPERIERNPKVLRYLSRCFLICPETKFISEYLQNRGFNNVMHVPNFKNYEFLPQDKKSCKTFKTVFFSRVCREKGVELAIEAVNSLSDKYRVNLDIYGPIQPDYREHFMSLMASSSSVNYMGILKPDSDETYEVLSNYDLMLFPTFHVGEGFPGALIDAYISGLPVIASDWKYNSEIIVEGVTGWLVSPKDVHSLEVAIENAIKNGDSLAEMRLNCVQEAKKYHVDNVLLCFLHAI